MDNEFRFGGIITDKHLRDLGVTISGDGTFINYANLHVKCARGF